MGDTRKIDSASSALLETIAGFHRRGWCLGTGGNFSLLLESEPLRLLMPPSGVDKGRLRADQLLQIDASGRTIGETEGVPSAETQLHLSIVRLAGAGSVLHTHSVWGTLMGERHLPLGEIVFQGYEMQKGIEGVTSHEQRIALPVVANSQAMPELSGRIESALDANPDARGVLIAGHGLYAWGATLDEARRHVEIYEFLLELAGRRASLPPLPHDGG